MGQGSTQALIFALSLPLSELTVMNISANELTDAQLIQQINVLGEEILATSNDNDEDDQHFDSLCDRYDECRDELDHRGLW